MTESENIQQLLNRNAQLEHAHKHDIMHIEILQERMKDMQKHIKKMSKIKPYLDKYGDKNWKATCASIEQASKKLLSAWDITK